MIPDPGTDPVEVAAVLMDGMDLVVLGLGGRSVSLTRARAVTAAPVRKAAPCWSPTAIGMGVDAAGGRVCGYETTCGAPGFGRISRVRLDVSTQGRAIRARTGEVGRCPPGCWRSGAWTGLRSPRRRPQAYPRRPGRGHPGQPGDRLLVGGPVGGRGAGLRRREATARCPQLHVVAADTDRDARLFERVIAAVDDLVPAPRCCGLGWWCCRCAGGSLFRLRAAGGRAADRRGGREFSGRCRVSGRRRRPVVHRSLRRAGGPDCGPGEDARFLSALSIRQLAAEPSLSGRAEKNW
ncbi:hypothetical protein I553_0515 [Mycobacterium xenopi 4042]|uniref:Uncharacterized protein n=1 Tax=Mycobacterium xenopi 4042 TaxID=1299334 RepID=X7YLL8_MYCXE|nr:hypothetical protein I553_0515 [Mycobacterium xenopi 4042]